MFAEKGDFGGKSRRKSLTILWNQFLSRG